jgi:energy-coupling factor transporter transmembrane protein EcfT
MAELNIFHYWPGNSIFHRMDGRIKLLCMVLLSITAGVVIEIPDFIILTIVLVVVFIGARLPGMVILKEMRYFAFWMLVIILTHSFSVPGAPILLLPIGKLTREGLMSGLLFVWRLMLMIIIGTIFTGTTSLSNLRNIIEWFLRLIPFLPASRVATILSLTFKQIPLIFDRASEILDAQRSRCIENRHHPLRRIRFLMVPLFLRIFSQADEIAYAMEARCYSEVRTPAVFMTRKQDWLALILTGFICLFILFRPWLFYL